MAGTGVGKYSTTASNNETVQSTNFSEGMAPSDVNNAARETMANIRSMYNQIGEGFVEYGDKDGEYTVARTDADTITITSSIDLTSVYYAGRPIRIVDGGSNTVTGAIASSSYSSPTLTVNLTGISLASGNPTKVELGPAMKAGGGRVILDDDEDTYISASTDDQVDVVVSGTAQIEVKDGSIGPTTDSDVDLGTTAKRFKDAFVDTLTTTGNLTVGGNLSVTGTSTGTTLNISGDVDVDGTLEADAITLNGTALAASATTDTTDASNISSGTLSSDRIGGNVITGTGSAGYYAQRAWVRFNSNSSNSIYGSQNVGSITDHGVGKHTVNFTTAMPNANYGVIVTPSSQSGYFAIDINGWIDSNAAAPTTNAVRVAVYNDYSLAYRDTDNVVVSVFGV